VPRGDSSIDSEHQRRRCQKNLACSHDGVYTHASMEEGGHAQTYRRLLHMGCDK
jgi:hypothetical protein